MVQPIQEPYSAIDRFFTLFFLVTSVIIVPTVMALINASSSLSDGGNLGGLLWSSIIAPVLIVVAVYGIAVLLNIQWLRLLGIYGLFCIFVEAWLMLFTWLSTSSKYWTLFTDNTVVSIVDFACLFFSIGAYRGWQKRFHVSLGRVTYLIGIVSSFNLFLVFNFLMTFAIYNIAGSLFLQVGGVMSMLFAQVFLLAIITLEKTDLMKRPRYLAKGGLLISEGVASFILIAPTAIFVSTSWVIVWITWISMVLLTFMLVWFTVSLPEVSIKIKHWIRLIRRL